MHGVNRRNMKGEVRKGEGDVRVRLGCRLGERKRQTRVK